MLINRLGIVFIFSVAGGAHAQNLQCPDISKTLKEYSIDSSSSSFLSAVFSEHCQQDGTRKSSGGGIGLDFVIKSIPVKFTGNYSSTNEGFQNFCKVYASQSQGEQSVDKYKETISRKSLETIEQCLKLQANSVVVTHQINNVESANFYLRNSVVQNFLLSGVDVSGDVKCYGINKGSKKEFDSSIEIDIKKTVNFACKRSGTPGPNGSTLFGEAVITLLTNQGNYSVFWPKDQRQSPDMATDIDRRLSMLEGDLALTKANVNPLVVADSSPVYKCPTGTVVSKNAAWMYAGCNGQYSDQATCSNVWYGYAPEVRQCSAAGNMKLFK